ncbi:MAG: hypothetical protein H0U10_11290, partial [Chloroflexia bacterium]|nr:hypothetical protein [Chloroflexia bacterium]
MGRTGSRLRGGWRMVGALSTVLALLLPLPLLPSPAVPAARAQHGGIMLPFEAGAEWFVSQGYNTSPEEGWSHYNCDPRTGKDEISQSSRCDDGWQYKYSFDLRRVDGEEAGQPVLSPASGVVRWVDPAYGGLSLDLGDGFAVAFFHVDLARGIAAGDELRVGQRVGHVSGPGGGGNGGTPHIHLTVWATEDGGNWSRTSVPFAGDHPLEGQAFPALPERERNQYLNAVLASSNAPAAPAATPEAPLPVAPADG